MPISYPPQLVVEEFLGATTRHTRRVEICEADGVTPWAPAVGKRLLVGGQVTVDYSRNERRAVDLELADVDNILQSAPGQFWYDKIIKVYRGVKINERLRVPKILIINDMTDSTSMAIMFRKLLVSIGYGDVHINQLATDYELHGKNFDIIISMHGPLQEDYETPGFLIDAMEDGKSILAFELTAYRIMEILYPSPDSVFQSGDDWIVRPRPLSTHPTSLGWPNYSPPGLGSPWSRTTPASAQAPYYAETAEFGNSVTAHVALQSRGPNPNGRGVLLYETLTNAFIDDHPSFTPFMKSAMDWLNTVTPLEEWEVQVGEFMIDRISEDNYPKTVKITGRDYTKKCLLSKYAQATQFAAGQSLEALINSIAGAAGITKRALPATGIVVGRTFFFDRGVTRWDAMKEICSAYDHDIYFDATGYLIIEPYADPATTPPSLIVSTGPAGVLAKFTKSTTDTRIYNTIVVTGESSDPEIPPVYAVAVNDDPLSPTSVQQIGERVYQFVSSFIETTAQAQAVADSFLAVHALEEYNLNFDSLMMPWVEVGDIVGFVDPDPAPDDPTTYLFSSFTIPIELGPMSCVGKRVTIVE